MITLPDPGANRPHGVAKQARLNAWRRPSRAADRQKLRQERIAMAQEAMK